MSLDSTKEAIAKRIALRRLELGWSQQEVAEKLGIRQGHVSAVENEGVSTLDSIQRWAKVLRCNPVWLAYGAGPIEQQPKG